MKKPWLPAACLALMLAVSAAAGAPPIKIRESAPGLLARAEFPPGKAFSLADKQVPGGMIVAASIEDTRDGLAYCFGVKVPGKPGIEEVRIDAMNGRPLGHAHADGAADDALRSLRDANARVKLLETAPGLVAKASYPFEQAVAKVESLVPRGRILAAALEQEGRSLHYAFDVRVDGKAGVEDIDISARSGRLLHWQHLTEAQYARDQQEDASRALRRKRAPK